MAKIKLPDGRTAEVRDDWAQDFGITDLKSLQNAAKRATGGINVFIDGKEYLFHDDRFMGNPGLRSGEQQDLGTGFLQDAAGFVQDHNKVVGPGSDNFKLAALAGTAIGAGAGLMGGVGGLSAETLSSIPAYEGALASEFAPLAGGSAAGAGGGGSLVSNALTGGAQGAGGGLSTLNGITAGGATPWGLTTSGMGNLAGVGGAVGSAVGPLAQSAGLGAASGGGLLAGLGGALSGLVPSGNGTTGNLLGSLLPAGLGYLGADSQANAMKDIYNQTRADRMPALNAYNTALQNPNTFYQSAPAMGAVDAVLRKLSVNGNPAANPGSLSQAAAYNLGGYNDYLRGLTPAAFGTANTEANISMQGAGADAGKYNALGYGLGQYLNPQPNLNDLLKNFSLNIGGVRA